MIANAERPLIIAGGGVHYSGAVEQLTAFAEKHGIPVTETVAGKATLVADHPNFVGPLGVTGVITTSSKLSAAARDIIGQACVNLDDQLEAGNGIWGLGVYWKYAVETDRIRRVVGINVGDTIDTQRSRRKGVVENRTVYPL